MRKPDSGRGRRSPGNDFRSVVMKWPLSHDGPGRPVSPGANRRVVGPSAPRLPNGTIRAESARSLRLRESRGNQRPSRYRSRSVHERAKAGQRHLLRSRAQGIFHVGLFRGGGGRQVPEVSDGLELDHCALVQMVGYFRDLVHRRADTFGLSGFDHLVQPDVIIGVDRSREFLAWRPVPYFRR